MTGFPLRRFVAPFTLKLSVLVITGVVAGIGASALGANLFQRIFMIAQSNGCERSESDVLRDWDKCAAVTCSSGNWTCTTYKDGTNGSTSSWGGSYSSGGGATGCWTCSSCTGMPDGESKNYCNSVCRETCEYSSGTNASQSYSSGTTSSYNNTNNQTNSDPYTMCVNTCSNDPNPSDCQQRYHCDNMRPGGSTSSSTQQSSAGTSSSAPMTPAECESTCNTNRSGTPEQCRTWCNDGNTMGPGSTQGGSTSSGMPGDGGMHGSSSMRDCRYPNASWRSDNTLGMTPGPLGRELSCSADYQGCEGIADPQRNLHLGAPRCCREGWSVTCDGSPSGGGDNAYDTTGCRYESSRIGTVRVWNRGDCDARISVSSVPDATARERELQACYAAVSGGCYNNGNGGNTSTPGGGCVSGCRSMTQQSCAGAMGDTQFWCRHWQAGTCEQACREREDDTQTYDPNQKFALCTHNAPAGTQQYRDCECRYLGRCGGGGGGGGDMEMCCPSSCTSAICPMSACIEVPRGTCPWKNGGDNRDGVDEFAKQNVRRMLKDYLRQAEEMQRSGMDVSASMTQISSIVQGGLTCVDGTRTYDGLRACEEEYRRKLDAVTTAAWQAIESAGQARRINEADQQINQMRQFLTTARGDPSVINKMEDQLSRALSAMSAAKTTNARESETIWQKFYDAMSAFWALGNELRYAHDDDGEDRRRGGYDPSEMCSHLQSEVGNVDNPEIHDVIAGCFDLVAQFSSGGEFDEQGFEAAMREIWQRFEALRGSDHEQDACRSAEKAIRNAADAMANEAQEMIAAVRSAGKKSIAGEMEAILKQGASILIRAQQAATNDCPRAVTIMTEEMERGIAQKFIALFDRSGVSKKKFRDVHIVDNRDDYRTIGAELGDSKAERAHLEDRLEEKGYGQKELLLLKELPDTLVKGALTADGTDIIRIAADLDMDDTFDLQQLLQTRANLEAEIAELEAIKQGLRADVVDFISEATRVIVDPSQQAAMEALLASAKNKNFSAKELRETFASIMKQSQRAFVKKGLIAFEDLPLDAWYTKHANDMEKRDIMTGIDGEFAGEQTLTVPMLVTMTARARGYAGEKIRSTSSFVSGMPAWARGPGAWLDRELADNDSSLEAVFAGAGPTAAATRMHIVRLSALFGLPPADTSIVTEQFADEVGALTQDEIEMLASLMGAGVIGGREDAEGNRSLALSGTLNRAECAKIFSGLFGTVETQYAEMEDDEDDDGDDADDGDNILHGAAEAVSSSAASEASSEPEKPVVDLHEVNEQLVDFLRIYVEQYEVGKKIGLETSLINDVRKALASVKTDFTSHNLTFGKHVKKVVNMENMLLGKQYEELVTIVESQGFKVAD